MLAALNGRCFFPACRKNARSGLAKLAGLDAFFSEQIAARREWPESPATTHAQSRESPLMSLQLYLAFVAACIALALLPGPVVTLVIANGLRHGTRAALTNIAGVQAGLTIVIGIVAVGLTSLMATMGYWFDWVRFAGAAYLVWLGIKLIRAPVKGVDADAPPPPPRGGFFLQGFVVLLSNPKVLVFFGAFIPQFMDMSKDHVTQVALLGATFMITGAVTDTIYALLAGRARLFFSARRTRLLSHISGGFMIGGGIWLALTRAR
jgi:threonine/homoserine/homoserine lactone efflux protein